MISSIGQPNPLYAANIQRNASRAKNCLLITTLAIFILGLITCSVLKRTNIIPSHQLPDTWFYSVTAGGITITSLVLFLSYREKKFHHQTKTQKVDLYKGSQASKWKIESAASKNVGEDLVVPFIKDGRFRNHEKDYPPSHQAHESWSTMYKGFFTNPPPILDDALYCKERHVCKEGMHVTWIGHASVLMCLSEGKKNFHLLTNPSFSSTIPLLPGIPLYKRATPPGLTIRELPPIDMVSFSHNHADHCLPKSVEETDHLFKPHFICPLGTGKRLNQEGSITYFHDLNWWEAVNISASDEAFSYSIEVTCVPAHHSSQTGYSDCQKELWCGYVYQIKDRRDQSTTTIYFMGDTAANHKLEISGTDPVHQEHDLKMFTQIKACFPVIDLAFVPIDPTHGEENVHANHDQLIDLLENILKPKAFIPVHWGTWPFNIYGQDMLAPLRLFNQKIQGHPSLLSAIKTLKVGGTFSLGKRSLEN